ncbi:MAG TPA: TonB-dependent receptor, partial [Saprospiraceae bacterium]|nr:TonB-dependent receptor [Saprospiraceae bacterium]
LAATGGTAAEALAYAPSITRGQNGEVLLRGSSSYTVLIDGKPAGLKAQEALKQMPSGRLDRIEIITSPSVKYDAEGAAGIINLITRRGMAGGISSQFNASAWTGDKWNADATAAYRSDKTDIHLGLNWRDETRYYTMPEQFRIQKNDQWQTIDGFFKRTQTDRDIAGNFSADFSPNLRDKWSYSAEGGRTKFYVNAFFNYDEYLNPQEQHNYTHENLQGGIFANYLTNQIGYTHKSGANREWSSSAFYSHIDYKWFNDQDRTHTGPDFRTEQLPAYYLMNMDNDNYSDELRFRSDYSQVFPAGGKLELGGAFHQYHRLLNLIAREYDFQNKVWIPNTVFTNRLDFRQSTYSAYGQYAGSRSGWNYHLGLRMEYTDRLTESHTLDERYPYRKLDFFPQVSISKPFGETRQIHFQYSRRIERPDEYLLNPFPDISNEYQQAYGNPLLRPNRMHNFELNFQQQFSKARFSVQGYWRELRKGYDQVIAPDTNGLMTLTFENVADHRSAGVENSLNLEVTKVWNVHASLNLYGERVKGSYQGYALDAFQWSFNSRLVQSISFGGQTSLQLSANYMHEQISALGRIEPIFTMEVAVKRSWFKDRLSTTLQMKDIFNTGQMSFLIDRDDYSFKIRQRPEYPVVLLTLSYTFKQYKKASQRVNTRLKLG